MAVRFLPHPAPSENERRRERDELAEVIDLRSRLPQIVERPEPVVPSPCAEPVEAYEEDTASDSRPIPAPATARGAKRGVEAEATSEPERDAREDGVRLLARKALSSGELRRALADLAHDSDEIEAMVVEFMESLYLDDLGLARVLTEGLRERKRASRAQIRVKLRERLLDDGAIEQALAELDDDEEHELLLAAAHERARRMSGLDRQTAERRLLGYLARRGWSGEPALRACREALDAAAAASGSGVSFR